MPFSEFVIIRPENEEAAVEFSVSKIQEDTFRISVGHDLLGQGKHDITLWLVVCNARQLDENDLCFRSLSWANYQARQQGASLTTDPLIESLHDVRHLDDGFKPVNSVDKMRLCFDLPIDLIKRSYLCHEFPVPVLDGGQYSTIDLPAFAEQAKNRH